MKKVLFILFQAFGNIPDGGDQCNKRNLDQILSIYGEKQVDVFFVRDSDHTSIKEVFNFIRYLNKGYYRAVTPKVVQKICDLAPGYEYVFLSSSLFGQIASGLKQSGYKGKVIVQFHNVETNYYDAVLHKNMPLRKSIIKCISKNEILACEASDIRLALNKRDADVINTIAANKVDYVLPITLKDKCKDYIPCENLMTSTKPLVVFIGSNFPPNANGVLWFVSKVLPYVNINFIVVGKDMDKLKVDNEVLKNIDVRSNVPDLSSYFECADIVISPIFSGSGMKVKTCESLMYGKNILGTDEAFEGYDLDFDKVGRKANTASEFIDYINKISETPIPRYNEYSRKIYIKKYSNESAIITFKKIFI